MKFLKNWMHSLIKIMETKWAELEFILTKRMVREYHTSENQLTKLGKSINLLWNFIKPMFMKHICWLHRWQSTIKYQERSLMFGYRNLNRGMFAIVGIYFCLRRHSQLIKFASMLIIRVNSLNAAILNWCAVLLFMTRKNRMNSSFFLN